MDGDGTPKPYHGGQGDRQVVCGVCEADTGVASSEFIESVLAPFERRGRIMKRGATKSLICVGCLARGKITRIS